MKYLVPKVPSLDTLLEGNDGRNVGKSGFVMLLLNDRHHCNMIYILIEKKNVSGTEGSFGTHHIMRQCGADTQQVESVELIKLSCPSTAIVRKYLSSYDIIQAPVNNAGAFERQYDINSVDA